MSNQINTNNIERLIEKYPRVITIVVSAGNAVVYEENADSEAEATDMVGDGAEEYVSFINKKVEELSNHE